ncbi:MAG: hypothetical protein ABI895_22845 [Deltaproteobacteria bacterium]
MLPAIVVDLGNQLGPNETAWVLDACNAAIVKGTCELDTTAAEAPRAVAIVRLLGSEGRSVRIEVGLREADRDSWSVRALEFAAQDPARERWRTVGLVLATLVGELEAAEEERQTQDGSGPPGTRGAAPAAASDRVRGAAEASTAKAAPPRPQPTTGPAVASPDDARTRGDAPPIASPTQTQDAGSHALVPHAAIPRPGVFVGVGILSGPGAGIRPLRWGGGARGGWISRGGWALSAAADYSQVSFDAGEIEVAWWRATVGPGYRAWLSERWSLDLGLEVGLRNLRVAPSAAGSIRSSAWSPLGAAHLEAWWQTLASGGAWAGLTMSSIGRETRLIDRGSEVDVVLPAAEFHAALGLWWAP